MKTINAISGRVLPLGRLGENDYTVILFDVGEWVGDYPGASIGLFNQTPGGTAYPVSGSNLTRSGSTVAWTVTSAELSAAGYGRCELVCIDGETVAKSIIWTTKIFDALDGTGDPPEPWESWQEEMQEVEAATLAAQAAAEAAVAHYPRINQGVWEVWQDGGWVSTGVEATGPQGETGATGATGAAGPYYTPSVNASTGVISWTNNGSLVNPPSVNIKGPAGQNGRNGVSPVVTVEEITGGHEVIIIDGQGSKTFDVMDGQDGADGQNGQNGADGYSPTASVSKSGGTATITITDKNGTTTAQVTDGTNGTNGTNGQDGAPGPGVASGGTDGQMLVKDGSTDYATKWANVPTVPSGATSAQVKAGTETGAYIAPGTEDAASFYGLAKAAGDTTQAASSNEVGTYTADAQKKIRMMLGIPNAKWEFLGQTTVAEDSAQVNITTDSNGQEFKLSRMLVQAWLKPSTTGTNSYVSANNLVRTTANTNGTAGAPTKKYMANGAKTYFEYEAKMIGTTCVTTGKSASGPQSTASLESTTGDGTYLYIRGFRLAQYSDSSLIPAGSVIDIYGIRIDE